MPPLHSLFPSNLSVSSPSPLHKAPLEILHNCEIGLPSSKVDHVLDLSSEEEKLIEIVDHHMQQRFDVDYPFLVSNEIRDDLCLKNNSSAPFRGHYSYSRLQCPLSQSRDELLQSFRTFQQKLQALLPQKLLLFRSLCYRQTNPT